MFRNVLLIAAFFCTTAHAQTIKVLESGKRVSMRGLSVVSDEIIWASGTGGNVARSTNGGVSFTWLKVPGYEKMDFRDIEAFDSNTAIIMGITNPAVVLKTTDGGKTWKKVFEDTTKGAFIDAMAFSKNDPKSGTIIGDPLYENGLYQLNTKDQGDTWSTPARKPSPDMVLKEGEAFFASSGTNLVIGDKNTPYVFASGGKAARLFHHHRNDSIPIMQGKESTGSNSVDLMGRNGVIVGGDFAKDTIASNNCVLFTIDGSGKVRFSLPQTPPHGYRSCVIYMNAQTLLACGTSGVDISTDGGKNWTLVSKDSFHVCQKAKNGKAVFLAGNGRIAKLEL